MWMLTGGGSMNILLTMPSPQRYQDWYDRLLERICILWPPLTLRQLEAITPDKHTVDVVHSHEKIKENEEYDVVGISYFTATAPQAYALADTYREKGSTVILGGYHASALPSEAKQHSDAVVIGEAEHLWPRVLHDIEHDTLQPFYHMRRPAPPRVIPGATQTSIPGMIKIGGAEATRGCPYGCEFCALSHSPFGQCYRKKPVEQVIAEITSIPHRYFVFYDGSLTVDPAYTKALFRRLRNLNKKFAAFGHASMVDDEELLRLARDAGCIAWDIGFESIYQHTIDRLNKRSNVVQRYADVVEKLHDYDMNVIGSFAFGFDEHTPAVFDKTLEAVHHWDIDSLGITILTPLPGTRLYDRLQKENRILTRDWSKYDLYHVVFQPKHMTPQELYDGVSDFVNAFYAPDNLLQRMMRNIAHTGVLSSLGINYHLISSRVIYKSAFGQRYIHNHHHQQYPILSPATSLKSSASLARQK